MREFVVDLEYAPGRSPLADALAAHRGATVRSLACHATPETLWRVDYATGTRETLEAIEDGYLDTDVPVDRLDAAEKADRETVVLDRTEESFVAYAWWRRPSGAVSLPHLALDRFGDGIVFETEWDGRHYTWRLLLPGDPPVQPFLEDLHASLDGRIRAKLSQYTDVRGRRLGGTGAERLLPLKHRRVLHYAVEYGYYDVPRRTTLEELAETLDLPRSTLSYRLRRAESELVTWFTDVDRTVGFTEGNES